MDVVDFVSRRVTVYGLHCCFIHRIYVGCNFECGFLLYFSPFLSPPPSFTPPHTHTHTLPHSCVHYSCEAIDCQEPLIRNAELKCSSTGRHFYNGDRCTIFCNSGYGLQLHQDDDIIKSQVGALLHTCL